MVEDIPKTNHIWQYQNNIQKSKEQISLLEWWTASDQKSQYQNDVDD